MNRRLGIRRLGSSLLAFAVPAYSADTGRRYRLGVLCPVWEDLSNFVEALSSVGYHEGRNLELQYARWDARSQLDARAEELVASRVDLIAAVSTEEIRAAKRATSSIPIVMLYGLAPIELGLVESLARPGGNVTGTVAVPLELVAKSVEVFRAAVPGLKRLTALVDVDPSAPVFLSETRRAALSLGLTVTPIQIGSLGDLEKAFSELDRRPPDGLSVAHGLIPYYDRIIRFAASRKLPAIYGVGSAVVMGGLISLTPNLPAVFARTAAIVDRILKGAKAKDIPVEQPLEYLLAVNKQTARSLGIDFPRELLLRANFVVE